LWAGVEIFRGSQRLKSRLVEVEVLESELTGVT